MPSPRHIQDLTREHDKALRSTRAKLQRAEAELRGSKQAATEAAARVSELESLVAKKDLQLDAAAQQVGAISSQLLLYMPFGVACRNDLRDLHGRRRASSP